jgi:tetratricopeptide (TPR) repeat protein
MPRLLPIVLSLVSGYALVASCARTPRQKETSFLDTGRKHLKARDFERAVLDFRNAAQLMPKDAEPHYQLGLTYLDSGDVQTAAYELMNAVKLDPKHVAAQLKVAELMAGNVSLDVVKQGREKAEGVLATSPNNADALRTLALTELRLEDSDDAVQHLEQALTAVPQDLSASMTLAMVKLRANDVAGAEQVLLKSAADAPRSPDPALVLGRFYQLVRKPADGEKQFRHALELDPKYGPALVALGSLLYGENKTDEAEQVFQRASALADKQYRPLHAIFLFRTGKTEAALHEMDQQYKADLQDRTARTRLVSAYVKLGRLPDAENVLIDALKRNSKDTDALMQRGELSLAAGKFQEAQTDLTEVLRTRHDSPEAHLIMARIHRARGVPQSQIQELTEVLRLNPRLLVARIELAHAFTLSNSPKSAIEVLDQAPPQDRQSLALTIERNTALFGLGDYAELQKGIERGLAIARDPRLLMQDGLLKLKQKNYKGSRASLEEALSRQPQDWTAVEALASSYQTENKKEEASAIVRKYTSMPPASASGQQFLGTWLLRTGDLPGAKTALQESKRIDSKSIAPDFGLAQIAVAEGKLDIARDLLANIVSREPRNLMALSALGEVEDKAGHSDAAINFYNRVLHEDPDNIPVLNNLAYLLSDTQTDPDRGLALAQKVKELAPENAAIDDTIGWAYYNKGLFRPALDYLTKAGNGGTPRRKCHLAMTYIKLGNRQQAATLLQAALKEEPSSLEAKRALQLLAQAR